MHTMPTYTTFTFISEVLRLVAYVHKWTALLLVCWYLQCALMPMKLTTAAI